MGLSATGFTLKRQEEFITELQAAFRASFGVDLSVDTANPDSVPGQLIGIFSERFALLYEMAQELYDSHTLTGASGIMLDNLAQLVGLIRKPATATTALVTLSGDPGLVVPAGQQYNTPSGIIFVQNEEVTLDGAGAATGVLVTAIELGAVALVNDTITVITTPLIGLSSVTNPAAALTGTDLESDVGLRLRITEASSVTGSTTVEAIRSRLLSRDYVQTALVVENATSSVVDGRPPHTFECILYPNITDTDDLQDLADLIWFNKAAGIGTYGNQPAIPVVDSQGYSHDVYFSFCTTLTVSVSITLKYGSSYPSDGDDLVKQAAFDYINSLGPGDDLQNFKLVCALAGITGLEELISVETASPAGGLPSTSNIVVAPNQIARVSALTDITVSSSPA